MRDGVYFTVLLGLLTVFPLGGCGGGQPATIDASSEDALKKSVEVAKADLPMGQATTFQQAIDSITQIQIPTGPNMTPEVRLAKLKEAFHGKTPEQIITDARQITAAGKNKEMDKMMEIERRMQ